MYEPSGDWGLVELRDYLRILRAHWVGIVVLTALGLVVALGWNLLQPRLYTANSSGYVTANGMDGSANSTLVGDKALAEMRVGADRWLWWE